MELQEITYEVLATGDKMPSGYYKKEDVDKAIAEKDFEIDRLKEFNAFLKQRVSNGDVDCSTLLDDLEQKDKEIAELKKKLQDQCVSCPVKMQEDDVVAEKDKEITELQDTNKVLAHNGVRLNKMLDEKDKEIAELKAKLEDAKATAYAESTDAGMRERRLKRALWLARAERAHLKVLEYWPDYCHNAHCRIAEQKWDKVERKCRAMADKWR